MSYEEWEKELKRFMEGHAKGKGRRRNAGRVRATKPMSNANNGTLMTTVKGVSHYQDSASKVHEGDPVTLVPEPENYFDKNAVRVICYGKMIGYIAKDLAPRIQALAKQGRVSGVISKKFPGIKKTGYNVGFRLCITIRDSEP